MPRGTVVVLLAAASVLLSGCSAPVSTRPRTEPVVVKHPPPPEPPRQQPVATKNGPPAHAKAHGQRRKFFYCYYPDSVVYYAPERKTWFWIEGDDWKFGARLPEEVRVRLGSVVTIDLNTDRPYERHEFVVANHPGRGGRGRASAGKRD